MTNKTPKDNTPESLREELLNRIPEDWGREIYIEPGWDWILYDVHRKLKALDPDYAIAQIKEKFGTLRFYFNSNHPDKVVKEIMEDITSRAETQSEYTCETCGNCRLGVPSHKELDLSVRLHSNRGHVKTLCTPCALKQGYTPVKFKFVPKEEDQNLS
jgi:hypothetical protein